ncbi:cysteine desulfurase family protein [Staphylococcus haemolyticus]|uniref:cysteine desulfurase family protein n=1 Tax=Staphylococcus haemolyticus TaxID=1283 RepID=UPI0029023B77|nr:cysteine desulfurase family protein [Staphylococcus haemolyticus]MDU0421703.1 cysteine desulfurase family protein [Staphylococcus haemolyticus]MDU0438483.1 cysteine desulfurase family protein [Staphylococcus haemolyticus]MDU0441419.1 cysteine desulfurase family protein [Staphylococcus haemolyticus]MDU0443358.1 cysteine desulfurase family protein [Staphylococcus haemolyticus]MDU0448351.1 cysteine desulfurase family protein [Staphylococcus haemolyticus]
MEVYADYAATTPVKPEVIEEMMTIYKSHFGNPSSIHSIGRDARRYLDESRRTVAKLLNAKPSEVIFTSGATESNNTAIKGLVYANEHLGNRIITTKIEHHSVLHVFEQLEKEGYDVTYLDVDDTGAIDLDQLKEALTNDTILVSIMFVNNEVGTVEPMYDIEDIVSESNALFHVDAVQAIGHLDVNFEDFKMDTLSLTAHKFGGPKGVGVLLVRDKTPIEYSQLGGEQETKRRAGTENLAQIVGLTKALELAHKNRDDNNLHLMQLKELFLVSLQERAIPFEVNGSMIDTTGHILNLYFPFIDVETMLTLLDLANIYVSSGSACTAGSTTPSHVLAAMYEDEERAKHSVRFSFNELTTDQEIKYIVAEIHKIYHKFKEE